MKILLNTLTILAAIFIFSGCSSSDSKSDEVIAATEESQQLKRADLRLFYSGGENYQAILEGKTSIEGLSYKFYIDEAYIVAKRADDPGEVGFGHIVVKPANDESQREVPWDHIRAGYYLNADDGEHLLDVTLAIENPCRYVDAKFDFDSLYIIDWFNCNQGEEEPFIKDYGELSRADNVLMEILETVRVPKNVTFYRKLENGGQFGQIE